MDERKINRLRGFDYSQSGYYFVTICTQDMKQWFGKVINRRIELNKSGKVIEECWFNLPSHYKNCLLDEYIIMPNHFHGIVVIDNRLLVGEGLKPSPTYIKRYSLFEIIRGFKTFSSRKIRKSYVNDFMWQRSFYDHIIRNEESLTSIRSYIKYNPHKWQVDEYNPERYFM